MQHKNGSHTKSQRTPICGCLALCGFVALCEKQLPVKHSRCSLFVFSKLCFRSAPTRCRRFASSSHSCPLRLIPYKNFLAVNSANFSHPCYPDFGEEAVLKTHIREEPFFSTQLFWSAVNRRETSDEPVDAVYETEEVRPNGLPGPP